MPDDDLDAVEPAEVPEAGPVGPDEAPGAEEDEGAAEGRVELNDEDVPPGLEPVEPAPVEDPAAEALPAELVVVELPVVELPGAEPPPLEPPVVEPLVGEGLDELAEPVEAAEPAGDVPGFAALFLGGQIDGDRTFGRTGG
ncbi:hypothetical protein QW131_21465 [Roseibium salinum]|nr:hypothetical protein [Roseibium salinum]